MSKIKFIKIEENEKLYQMTAKALAKGRVVGWFQERSEFGPRALGNRSILFDPRRKDAKDYLNKNVKFRESWRPYAPVIMAEYIREFFDIPKSSPYMLLSAKVKNPDIIPGVTHIDETARVQTVTKTQNERLWKLLKAFKAETEVPVLLNTSFNIAGEPIVESPQDAYDTFLSSAIDILVMGNFFVVKKEEGNAREE